jgi:hypothetical protein
MIKYIIIHNKHEGCYDFKFYQDEVARIRATSITINPPKIFMFNTRDEAQDFFEEYINDVDCIDIKCKKGDEVEHVDYCTCGIIELDDKGEPILFYNKKNQIFLMEHGPQLFLPNQELKNDIRNLNLTNNLISKCKTLGREQRKRYIELGKYCEECNADSLSDSSDDESTEKNIDQKNNEKNDEKNDEKNNEKNDENIVIQEKVDVTSDPVKNVEKKKRIVKKKNENISDIDTKDNNEDIQTSENKKKVKRIPKVKTNNK